VFVGVILGVGVNVDVTLGVGVNVGVTLGVGVGLTGKGVGDGVGTGSCVKN
jgi:hypothetical protein